MLAGLAMLGPFSIDTYLPSFSAIAQEFRVDPVLVQQTLSAYLVCFAAMMLFHGTLSDAFGRRPVILVSLAVYTLASFGAAIAPNLTWLIVFRALQGCSAGAGTVVGRAIIRDRMGDIQAQRMLSNVTLVFAIAPAVAPVLGGWLQVWFGWRAIFVFLTMMALSLGIVCWHTLPESLPGHKRHAFQIRQLLVNYLTGVRNLRFLLLVFALAFASIGYFVYIASAPQFVPDVLHLPETGFGWLFLPIVGGMMIGATAASRLAIRWSSTRFWTVGYLLIIGAVAFNLAYNIFAPARIPWAVVPLVAYTFGVALVSPAMMLLILNEFPAMRGLAASIQAFVQTLLYAAVAAVVAPVVGGSGLTLAMFGAVTAMLSLGCTMLAIRCRHARFHSNGGADSMK